MFDVHNMQERFDLSNLCDDVSSNILNFVFEKAKHGCTFVFSFEDMQEAKSAVSYTIDGVRYRAEMSNSHSEHEIFDLINVSIDVSVSSSHKTFVDGEYVILDKHSEIPRHIILKATYFDDTRLLGKLIKSVLAHEIQHAVQEQIYGWKISNSLPVEKHAFDPCEIDARVEELLASYENDQDVRSIAKFQDSLPSFICDYLQRNGIVKEDKRFNKYYEKMFDKHVLRFRQKFLLFD